GRNFPRGRLLVWIVTGDAEQPTAAFHIALAQRFGHEVLEQRVAGRFTAANRQDEYSERVGQRSPGPEVSIALAGHQGPGIQTLVAVHTDVVGEPARQLGRINDAPINIAAERRGHAAFLDVQRARAVTDFAADRQFEKWRALELATPFLCGLPSAAVTKNAVTFNRPAEAQVSGLVAGRQIPLLHFGVVGERRLEQIVAPPHQASESVGARAHDVADLLFVAKDFLAVRIQLIFALKEIGAAPVNLIVTVRLGVFDGRRMVEAGELLQLARERHGAA